jgi:hypothetical protein
MVYSVARFGRSRGYSEAFLFSLCSTVPSLREGMETEKRGEFLVME